MKKTWLFGGVAALLAIPAGLHALSRRADYQLFGELVDRVETDERVVALTYDDGPDPRNTERMLDVLDEHDVKATFFMVGQQVEKHPALARMVAARGHEVGNHSWSHRRMIFVSPTTVREEIDRTDEALLAAGIDGPFSLPRPIRQEALRPAVGPVRDGPNERPLRRDPAARRLPAAARRRARRGRGPRRRGPGSIVVLHDGGGPRDETIEATGADHRGAESRRLPLRHRAGASAVLGRPRRGRRHTATVLPRSVPRVFHPRFGSRVVRWRGCPSTRRRERSGRQRPCVDRPASLSGGRRVRRAHTGRTQPTRGEAGPASTRKGRSRAACGRCRPDLYVSSSSSTSSSSPPTRSTTAARCRGRSCAGSTTARRSSCRSCSSPLLDFRLLRKKSVSACARDRGRAVRHPSLGHAHRAKDAEGPRGDDRQRQDRDPAAHRTHLGHPERRRR